MKNAGICMKSGVFVMPKSVLKFRREKGIFPVRKGAGADEGLDDDA